MAEKQQAFNTYLLTDRERGRVTNDAPEGDTEVEETIGMVGGREMCSVFKQLSYKLFTQLDTS